MSMKYLTIMFSLIFVFAFIGCETTDKAKAEVKVVKESNESVDTDGENHHGRKHKCKEGGECDKDSSCERKCAKDCEKCENYEKCECEHKKECNKEKEHKCGDGKCGSNKETE